MSFFNRVQKGLDSAKFKADQLLRINQVKNEVASIRREITEIHRRIADTTIQLHRNGMLSESDLTQLCLSIDQLNADIQQKEAQIAAIRSEGPEKQEPTPAGVAPPVVYANMQTCPHCDYQVPAESEFCPECGKALRETEVEPSAPAQVTADELVCPECGIQLPPKAVFCPGCGAAVGEISEDTTQE